VALLGVLGLLLVLSRPWLEAIRPLSSLPLLAGIALSPDVSGLIPRSLLGALEPVTALAGGWLALLAAESFDVATLRRSRPGRRALLIGVPALLAAGAAWASASSTRTPVTGSLLLLTACAAVALDPAAVRASLGRTVRPDAAARLSPSVACFSLGLALAATAFASVPPSLGQGAAGSFTPWAAIAHGSLTLLLGAALGFSYVAPLRLAPGKVMLPALLASMALVGWGLAQWLGMSPLALVFVAGVVLANDGARRDLILTTLAELERPFTLGLLFLAGASTPASAAVLAGPGFWILAAALLIIRPLGWRLVPAAGLTAAQALPLSPLAPAILLGFPGALDTSLAAAIALVFVLSETAWTLFTRRLGGR
jgi:hypothetical protein